jgi:hypothetical protein
MLSNVINNLLNKKGYTMRPIIAKNITLSMLLLSGLTTYSLAESNTILPVSTQLKEEANDANVTINGVEIVPEIIIKTEDSKQKKDPSLKEGVACDEMLEAAKLETDNYQDIPMAETIPCDKVDCSGLKSAKLFKDTYKKIPMAKTTKIQPCRKK